MLESLLRTKLFVPPVRPTLVRRPRLIERLNQGLRHGHKLALISAPAGFGKTTLISEWVNALYPAADLISHLPAQAAWLSLDEDDHDLTRFLIYFSAAVSQLAGPQADSGTQALTLLQSPQPPPLAEILTLLINGFAGTDDRTILVLDDYHVLDAPPIDDALAFLLEHLPPQVLLVIATRVDPQLPLARLRARGQLTELRAADLRFTPAEAAEFLNQAMGLDLSTDDIAALETRTEGWITGLQLAAISMRGSKDAGAFIKSFAGSHRFVLDYLIEEVLSRQPPEIQRFLSQTAILDRLTGPLCDAVRFGVSNLTDGSDRPASGGQAILEMLEHANLFIIPLDNERQWYRYHHLFAEVLRTRFLAQQSAHVATLHLRASAWYEHEKQPTAAIRHALAAGDLTRAADLAERVWPGWNSGFRSITWLGWVKGLPDEIVRARPVLSLAFAWAFLNAGKLEEAESRLQDVERWLEPPDGTGDALKTVAADMVVVDEAQFRGLPASLATARAYHAQATGDVRGTVRYVARVLELLPADDRYNRAANTLLLGLAHWTSGDVAAAHDSFSAGLFQNDHDLIKGTFVVAEMKVALGRLREAQSFCEHALRLAAEVDEPFPFGSEDVYSAMSQIHRELGELKRAAADLASARRLGEQVDLPDWQHRYLIAQARLQESRGDLDGALDLLEEAERVYVRTPVPEVRPIAALKARVWIRQGRLADALSWAYERGLNANDDLSYLREFEHLTLARVLIGRYRNDRAESDVSEAIGLLKRLLRAADERERMGSVLEILVLQALAYEAQGDLSAALESLERALTLAEPEGYIRTFVDEGQPLARLLRETLKREIAPEYARRLLAAFAPDDSKYVVTSAPPSNAGLVEPLSERELEVLQRIADGLTNREIADRLYLSLNTVKVHTRNIYGKLGVHNRTQAVARARALKLLPSS